LDWSAELDAQRDPSEVLAAPGPRQKWALTQEAWDGLLASLGQDRDSAGEKYIEIRGNLTRFFEWRGCPFPEDHADETINRVAKRIAEGEEIRNPSSYCIGVARMLLLEIAKGRAREQQALGEAAGSQVAASDDQAGEGRIECLRSCLAQLPADNRDLIIEYYQGEKGAKIQNRKRLTERFGVPVNTLRMRALRLREKLQACVQDCVRTAT
jgi:DNA-directed RNA polymerase specialized sigma24 family protein